MAASTREIPPPPQSRLRSIAAWFYRHPNWTLFALLAVPMAWMLAVYVGSLTALLAQSFFRLDEFSGRIIREFGLSTYQQLFSAANVDIVVRTTVMAALVTVTCALIAFPLAYYMARYASFRTKTVLYLAVLLPPVVLLLLVTLFIVFRNLRDVLLSVLSLCAGVAALMATMSLLGQSWNLASLAAIPLLLGTGIDYSIHILLALRRTGNDIRLVRATTGRAVFFAGMTTVIGFSSLVFANNRGLSALGLACCAGVLWVLLIVLWLMPHWRAWLVKSGAASGLAESSSAK